MSDTLRPQDYAGHIGSPMETDGATPGLELQQPVADPLGAWMGVLAEFTTTLRDVLATLSRIEARMGDSQ